MQAFDESSDDGDYDSDFCHSESGRVSVSISGTKSGPAISTSATYPHPSHHTPSVSSLKRTSLNRTESPSKQSSPDTPNLESLVDSEFQVDLFFGGNDRDDVFSPQKTASLASSSIRGSRDEELNSLRLSLSSRKNLRLAPPQPLDVGGGGGGGGGAAMPIGDAIFTPPPRSNSSKASNETSRQATPSGLSGGKSRFSDSPISPGLLGASPASNQSGRGRRGSFMDAFKKTVSIIARTPKEKPEEVNFSNELPGTPTTPTIISMRYDVNDDDSTPGHAPSTSPSGNSSFPDLENRSSPKDLCTPPRRESTSPKSKRKRRGSMLRLGGVREGLQGDDDNVHIPVHRSGSTGSNEGAANEWEHSIKTPGSAFLSANNMNITFSSLPKSPLSSRVGYMEKSVMTSECCVRVALLDAEEEMRDQFIKCSVVEAETIGRAEIDRKHGVTAAAIFAQYATLMILLERELTQRAMRECAEMKVKYAMYRSQCELENGGSS